jgi:Tol biopolymer transport system component
MKRRIMKLSLIVSALALLCLVPLSRVRATFPGKNGRIAFVQGPDIFTMNPDGSDVRQLTSLGADSSASWEFWSPDGKQLVFTEFNPPDFLGQLWLMNADGSNQHVLLTEPDFDDSRSSFSPDGTNVIFSRCRLDLPETCALYLIGADGTGLTEITPFELGITDRYPMYSPDGNTIVFLGLGRDGIVAALYIADADGSNIHRITPPVIGARIPTWSPDGKTIAFQTHCCNPQNQEIWVVNPDGSGLKRLTNNGDSYFAGPHDFAPSWSPQGDAIVFERDAPDFSSGGIVVISSDGHGLSQKVVLPRMARHEFELPRRRGQVGKGPVRQIQNGGALPRWGAAPN